MDGRVYSADLDKMMSPDPVTAEPDNGRNYNRYAYVFNNPLMYRDLTGYCVLVDDMNLLWFGNGDIGFGASFIPRVTFHNPLFPKIDLSDVKESLDKIDEITEKEWSGLSEWLALNVDGLNESGGGRQTELGFDEKIKILADAYLGSGLEF